MTDLFKSVTDSYWRQARLYPALLTIVPSLVVVLAFWPQLLSSATTNTLVAVAGSFGLLYAVAVVARSRGKKTERRLLKSWEGWPTTLWLRYRTGFLQHSTLDRYRDYLNKHVPGLALPTAIEEKRDPEKADKLYASAVEWLKEHRRGKSFPLVEKENAEYGFRRNLRGMRVIGVWLCALGIAACAVALEVHAGASTSVIAFFQPSHLLALAANHKVIVALLINAASVALWFAVVEDDWVREAADQYARALLATCDADIPAASNRAKRPTVRA